MIGANDITLREEELATILESPAPLVVKKKPYVLQDEPVQLTSFMGSPILRPFPTAGGEADLYLIERSGVSTVLKLYRFGLAPREEILQRIRELSRNFSHCFVPLLEYGYDPATRRWYELLEFIPGGSLKDLIEGGSGATMLPVILPQLAEALAVLHEHRILHLDLKPSNILVRTTDPLQVVLADFGISSFLDPELSRKMTTVKGTPHYWSPESFTGVVGAEADYWSLGLVLLEMLQGKHPFFGMDPKVIMFTLSTKGVELDDSLKKPYRDLLMGLLTRRPGMRWGQEQLRQFLAGDPEIPTYYNHEVNSAKEAKTPFRFMGKEYREIGDLLAAPLTGEEGWNGLRLSIENGSLERWLADNGNLDTSLLIAKAWKDSVEDADLALIRTIYQFRPDLPFILYGRQISLANLHLFATKTVNNESNLTERIIIDDLMKGRLAVYYGEYLFLTGKQQDPLYQSLKSLGELSRSNRYYYDMTMDPADTLKILDVMLHPDRWFLPDSFRQAPLEATEFLVSNYEMIRTQEEVDEYIARHLTPKDLQDALQAVPRLGQEHFRKCCTLLHRLKTEKLLPDQGEYGKLAHIYLLPPELSEAIRGGRYVSATAAWKTLQDLQSRDLLLEEGEKLRSWLEKNSRDATVKLQHGILIHIHDCSPLTTPEYTELAITIKRNIIVALIPVAEKLSRTLREESLQGHFPSCGDITLYIEALVSREVPWDEIDRRVVKNLYDLVYTKKVPVPELLGQVLPPSPGGIRHFALETLLGQRIYENSPMLQWMNRGALAGILVGLCFAFSMLLLGERYPVVSFFMAAAIALLHPSKKVGAVVIVLTCFFLLGDQMYTDEIITRTGVGAMERIAVHRTFVANISETILDLTLMSWIGILLGSMVGARMGGCFENLTDGERFLADFRARIDVVIGKEAEMEVFDA